MADEIRWEGSDSLRDLLVPIDEVIPHPSNPRRGNLDILEESLTKFGQVRPILVNKATRYIVAGNHTYRTAIERKKWTHIARVLAELDEDEERQYLLMDNRSSDVGAYDDDALIASLNDLMERGKLVGTGYDADSVENLIAEHDKIAEAARQDSDARYAETPEELAEREALRQGGKVMREVVLTYPEERFERFRDYLKILQKSYGTTGVMDTVYEAIERAAKAE